MPKETIVDKLLVSKYGTVWARNKENVKRLRDAESNGKLYGVYVLCDGSMPVYIGRGRLTKRIARHQRSKSRGQFWDHFSWFAIPKRSLEADVEALLLRMLPFYLRSLNKQRSKFVDARRIRESSSMPDKIERPPLWKPSGRGKRR